VTGQTEIVRCCYRHRGFTKGQQRYRPCGVVYHTACVRVGAPFQSRRDDGRGLQFPTHFKPGVFICEACTVRSVLGRELQTRSDAYLLSLERMRILDVAHSWSPGSYHTYQPYLRAVVKFETDWHVNILRVNPPVSPPDDPIIPLMWCHESYGLRPGRKGQLQQADPQVSFATVRQLRAAVAQWQAWTTAVSTPGVGYFDQSRRLLQQNCRATDTATFTLFAKGLAIRTGTESRPSKSLLYRHVAYLDRHLNRRFRLEEDPYLAHETALAGTFNAILWLGWLRSSEALGLRWMDLLVTSPADGPQLGLTQGTGAVRLRLRPETKSQRSVRADMILAYKSGAGIPLGLWLSRARTTYQGRQNLNVSDRALFVHPDNTAWTSLYYRERYLYPSLYRQRAGQDPWLTPFNAHSTVSLEEAFWSLSSYRNGARSWVSRPRMYGSKRQRKATPEEVYEHGRWRRQRNSEAIDKVYQQWTYEDRVAITLYCM